MAARPKAPITSPEITLIQRRTGGVIRDRKAAAILVRISHQAAEPVNTPRVSSPASGRGPVADPEAGEQGGERQDRQRVGQGQAQDRQVGTGQPAPPRARSSARAGHRAGGPPGEPDQEQAADEAEQPAAADEQAGDRRQAERGDSAVRAVGGCHSEARREADLEPALGQGPADHEERDLGRPRPRWSGRARSPGRRPPGPSIPPCTTDRQGARSSRSLSTCGRPGFRPGPSTIGPDRRLDGGG